MRATRKLRSLPLGLWRIAPSSGTALGGSPTALALALTFMSMPFRLARIHPATHKLHSRRARNGAPGPGMARKSALSGGRTPFYTCVPHRSHEVMYMARGRPPVCIHCGSSKSTAKGVRRTKTKGIRRLRVCKDCSRKFTPRHQTPQAAEPTDGAGGVLLNGSHTDH